MFLREKGPTFDIALWVSDLSPFAFEALSYWNDTHRSSLVTSPRILPLVMVLFDSSSLDPGRSPGVRSSTSNLPTEISDPTYTV